MTDQTHILLVEDEERVAQSLCRVLSMPEGGGFQVRHCASAEDALTALNERRFDLLITDLRLPGMSGLALLERLPALNPQMRSLLITAYGSPHIEERAKRLANAYLPKPFSMQTFVRTVRQTLLIAPELPRRVIAYSAAGLNAIQHRIELLRADLGASGALLLDQAGQLLTETGRRGDFDVDAFLALMGNAMSASNEVCHLLRDAVSFDLHFHEGVNYELYTARITDRVFLNLLLDRRQGAPGRVGLVWGSLRRAIADLRVMLEQAEETYSAPLSDDIANAFPSALDAVLGNAPATPPPPDPGIAGATMTYEQARALGLINFDDVKAD